MTINSVKDVYTYLVKGMLKLFKNLGITDDDLKSGMSEAMTKFKSLKLEDSDKVNDICDAVNEELKNLGK